MPFVRPLSTTHYWYPQVTAAVEAGAMTAPASFGPSDSATTTGCDLASHPCRGLRAKIQLGTAADGANTQYDVIVLALLKGTTTPGDKLVNLPSQAYRSSNVLVLTRTA